MKAIKPQEIIYLLIILITSFVSALSSTTYTPKVIGVAIGTIVGAVILGAILLGLICIFYGKFSRRRLLLFTSISSVLLLIGNLQIALG